MRIQPMGDAALIIELGGTIDEESIVRVRRTVAQLDAAAIPGVTDVVPAYTSVAVHYDPLAVLRGAGVRTDSPLPYAVLRDAVARALAEDREVALRPARTIEIPVHYGGERGPDLPELAAAHGMSADDVIAVHTGATYTVHVIGFLPGFCYLGGLDPRLATPRRASPRGAVPAGSVGIGGEQTGVYPLESPGGWHLIGMTPLRMFDAAREEPALLRVGDQVRFRAIDATTFVELAGARA